MAVTDGDILRIVASMLWGDGNINQNVFNAKVTGGSSPYADADILDDAEDWLDNMYANLTTQVSNNLDGNEVVVYVYDNVGQDWDEVSSQAWGWLPTGSGDYLPRAVAALVRLWTTDADVQGKKYVPGMLESTLVSGLWNSTLITALLAFAADWYIPFVGSASGATFTPGIWSVANLVFKAGIDHVATSTIPAYQRRRKRNIGI